MFYANSWGRLLAVSSSEGHRSEAEDVRLSHILLGGLLSQLVIAPTVTAPLERIKVLLQVFPGKFSGQTDCLSYIIK